jgi:DNA-binding LacI/PurR family transcriptional regulator
MAKGSFVSKLQQTKNLLLNEIARQGLAEGDRIPTRSDWCKRLGISNDTLDKALRQLIDSGVLVATRGRGTFVNQEIQPIQDNRGSRQARIIDIFVPFERGDVKIGSPQVHLRRLDGVALACRDAGFAISLHFLDAYKFIDLQELLAAVGPLHDAAVFFDDDLLARMESHLQEAHIPFVAIGQVRRPANSVMVSVTSAYNELMAHLAAIGRTRLAYVSLDPAGMNSHLSIVQLAAANNGIRPKRLYWVDKDLAPILERLIKNDLRSDKLDAILFRNDAMALQALTVLKSHGVRVPEDVVVLGYNDIPEAALADPPLATVAQPYEGSGSVAIECVARMLETRTLEFESVTLEAQLVLRKSALPDANS